MKIAFVKQKYVPFGGGERYTQMLMQALQNKGHDIHLVTSRWFGSEDRKITIHPVQMSRFSRAGRSLSFSKGAKNEIEKQSFDLVISLDRTECQHVWRAGEGVHSVWLNRRKQFEPPLRTWLNKHSRGQKALLELEKKAVMNSSLILANSHMVKNDLLITYSDIPGDINVIHNGVDLQRFSTNNRIENRTTIRQQHRLSTDIPVILFVGSGFKRKGLGETLQALAATPEAHLVVIGRDNATPWKALATKHRVEKRVHFLQPQQNLPAYYHAADVLSFPSWFDSFGFVGLESMACGTPIVTTRYAGVHETITEPEAGSIITAPSAIDELSTALQDHIENRNAHPERISQAVSSFSDQANIEETVEALHSLKRG